MEYDLEKLVTDEFLKIAEEGLITVDTEKVTLDFFSKLKQIKNEDFIKILITSGYIPDLYDADSKEETLYTKLCEALEVEWANRMGYEATTVTQKSSYEDVVIKINGKVIVSDTKSFRLTRSQAAPNVKDFVKPEDHSKWIKRHGNDKVGGLIVYPQLHEWAKGSDAHSYCSDKKNPIVMLPYHYLAYLLDAKIRLNFETSSILSLWDYETMFESSTKNRVQFWKNMNQRILEITGDSKENMIQFLLDSEEQMYEYVISKMNYLRENRVSKISEITQQIEALTESEIKENFLKYKISQETDHLVILEERLEKYRLDNNNHTKYNKFIKKSF